MTTLNKNYYIKTALINGEEALHSVSETPLLDTEVLICHVMGISRTTLLIHGDHPLSTVQAKQFEALLAQRSQQKPIAYLVGYQEFWSLRFIVNTFCLIPRPETELLVEKILEHYPENKKINLLELGTGSGAIALAIAYHRPKWTIVAVDRSQKALEVASVNKKLLRISNVTFACSNWFQNIQTSVFFDGIISNPPYLSKDDLHLQSLRYEPKMALVADENGLKALRTIIFSAKHYLSPQGKLWLEHGYSQHKQVWQMLQTNAYTHIKQYQDLASIVRISAASYVE